MIEEHQFPCPHCWEEISILLDTSLDGDFQVVEDCEVCCNPAELTYRIISGRLLRFQAECFQ